MNTPAKNITFNKETRDALLKGVQTINQAVGSTLGPMGRNVIIETPYGATTVTKDGVTVAKHITLSEPTENLAVTIIKQSAGKTADKAGDGTTTSTIIASALATQAMKLIELGYQPIDIKRTFQSLSYKVKAELEKLTSDVSSEDILKIANISANNDEVIGQLIHSAFEYVGKQGMITLSESKTGETYVDLLPGISIDKGYTSPTFITDHYKSEVVLENPLVFITDAKIRHEDEVIPILEYAHSKKRPLFIIADSIDGRALQLLMINKLRQTIQVSAIEGPSFGENRAEIFKDLAALTSAKIHSPQEVSRVQDIDSTYFGSAGKVISTKDSTMIIQPSKDEVRVAQRVETLKQRIQTEVNDYFLQQLKKRSADLQASVATIYVGAATETELKETKDRVDDALRATSAAVAKGYLVGGGLTLYRVANSLPSIDPVHEAFKEALTEPLKTIVRNAGLSPEVVVSKIQESGNPDYGFNAKTLSYSDLRKDGVIDPSLVVEQAVTNAVSAANMLVLSGTAMTLVDRTPPYSPPSPDYV